MLSRDGAACCCSYTCKFERASDKYAVSTASKASLGGLGGNTILCPSPTYPRKMTYKEKTWEASLTVAISGKVGAAAAATVTPVLCLADQPRRATCAQCRARLRKRMPGGCALAMKPPLPHTHTHTHTHTCWWQPTCMHTRAPPPPSGAPVPKSAHA